MDLQTKQNIATVAAGLAVMIGLSIFVSLSNQNEAQVEVIQEVQEIHSEVESLPVSDKIHIESGYVITNKVDVMSEPSESSDVVRELMFNELVEYSMYNENWLKIEYEGQKAYALSKCISSEKPEYESYQVERTSGFKSYMDYRKITNQSSQQFKLQTLYAETDENGIRTVNGRYCVALGSYFIGEIGQYVDLVLADGNTIQCILADQKADVHTDSNNIVTVHSGCMSEFVVDADLLNDEVKAKGDMSCAVNGWDNFVVQVRVYDKNVFDEE